MATPVEGEKPRSMGSRTRVRNIVVPDSGSVPGQGGDSSGQRETFKKPVPKTLDPLALLDWVEEWGVPRVKKPVEGAADQPRTGPIEEIPNQ